MAEIIGGITCPMCAQELRNTQNLSGGMMLRPGSVIICFHCAAITVAAGPDSLRPMFADEYIILPEKQKVSIAEGVATAMRAIVERGKQQESRAN